MVGVLGVGEADGPMVGAAVGIAEGDADAGEIEGAVVCVLGVGEADGAMVGAAIVAEPDGGDAMHTNLRSCML